MRETFSRLLFFVLNVIYVLVLGGCKGISPSKFYSPPTQNPVSTSTGSYFEQPDDDSTTSLTPSPIGVDKQSEWEMIFQDEFDGNRLNNQLWETELAWGRTSLPELQYYTPDSFILTDGILRIKAEKRRVEDQAYTSGAIATFNSFSFTYGYVESSFRVPAGQGLWPAFWLLFDGPREDEIDVMEILGDRPDIAYMTLHYYDSSGNDQETGSSFEGVDFSKDFHTFAVDWTPHNVTWYIDGVEQYSVNFSIPSRPMYLIANLAVGGEWPGPPDSSTEFPAFFDIDYIRVYQRK